MFPLIAGDFNKLYEVGSVTGGKIFVSVFIMLQSVMMSYETGRVLGKRDVIDD
jgi:hypothetical protein